MSEQDFFPDMSNADYHKEGSISKTKLDLFARDPFGPEWSRKCPQDQEKLKTFDFGDAMHAICLEPDRLNTEFVEAPGFNLRTNDGKAAQKEFIEAHKDFKILSPDDFKKLRLMFDSVMAHNPARKLIETVGIAEGSYFWTDDETGLLCKCRPDKHIEGWGLLVDVKTTPDLKKFHYSVDDFRYYVQDPWYCDGVGQFGDPVTMEFLVIQKTIEIGRYPVQVVKLPDDVIEYGRIVYRENLRAYADFLSSDKLINTPELKMSWQFMERAEDKIAGNLV